MNKSELIQSMAEASGLNKSDAGKALDAFVSSVQGALKRGDSVAIGGFGSFLVRDRAARKGYNPRTGESIQIKASKAPAFKAALNLKKLLN